jgi:hypothetical protein
LNFLIIAKAVGLNDKSLSTPKPKAPFMDSISFKEKYPSSLSNPTT